MPAQELAYRTQKAVVWPLIGVNDFGEPQVGEPIELLVRWEQGREESINRQGQPIALDATVVVDREIAIGSTMWKGALENWDDEQEDQLMFVADYSEIPDLKGRNVRRIVKLRRFREDLPENPTVSSVIEKIRDTAMSVSMQEDREEEEDTDDN